MEKQIEYVTAAILKIQRERIKSIEVKKEAVCDFDEYIDVGSLCCTSFFILAHDLTCRVSSPQ